MTTDLRQAALLQAREALEKARNGLEAGMCLPNISDEHPAYRSMRDAVWTVTAALSAIEAAQGDSVHLASGTPEGVSGSDVPARPTSPAEDARLPYICPKGCGCMWRDNGDGTMSLLDGQEKSCEKCEPLPLAKLTRMTVADNLFIDDRGDGVWLVCLHRVHDSMESAQRECRAWKRVYASLEPTLAEDHAAFTGWARSMGFDVSRHPTLGPEEIGFMNSHTTAAWQGWQRRATPMEVRS